MKVRTYKEALRLATAAGADVAAKSMRTGGRQSWSAEDFDLAANETSRVLKALGYGSKEIMMTDAKRDDSGPAFPVPLLPEYVGAYQGMTLRDYFAGQALGVIGTDGFMWVAEPSKIAARCYSIAEAMISERNKQQRT